MWPSNEAETIELYKLMQERLGWRIVHLQTAFPDAVIENRHGAKLIAEFEFLAKNFLAHGHNPSGCDLVICWHNNWYCAPMPIWALEDCIMPARRKLTRAGRLRHRLRQERGENSELRRENYDLKEENANLKVIIELRQMSRFKPIGSFEIEGVGKFYTETERDFERGKLFLSTILGLSEGKAIQDWIRTADIPSKVKTRQLLADIPADVLENLDKLGR